MKNLIPRHAGNETFVDDAGGREKQDQRRCVRKKRSPTHWLLQALKHITSPFMV
jgi:hypothetical protein